MAASDRKTSAHAGGGQAFILFGATGDLAMRMLFPSLWWLHAEGQLPDGLRIIGVGRTAMDDEAFRQAVDNAVIERAGDADRAARKAFLKRIAYVPLDAHDAGAYAALAEAIGDADEKTYYLSTSPALYGAISANLKASGLADRRSRILIEKPLGRDLASCREINSAIAEAFTEDNTFRIDHYLGKETVQNILALRFANTMFEPLWSAVSIDHVQITIAETVGVEGRWSYYDDYGAIRDMAQNHLLQLLCLVAMEPPASLDPDSVRNEKVKVLRSLRAITAETINQDTVRGQYAPGVSDGASVPGYLSETGAEPSDTETFVAIRAHIDNWRWAGVPFYLRTGKRMPERKTQIFIQFRRVPHSIFHDPSMTPNQLIIDLQPEEEITLLLMNGTPGLTEGGMRLRPLPLNLSLTNAFRKDRPRRRIAYERLLYDALRGRSTLFVRRDEAEAAWEWIDAIVDGWRENGGAPKSYPAGAWGPPGAYAMIERGGRSWND